MFYLSPKALASLLGYVLRLGAVPPAPPLLATPAEALLGRYRGYLVTERGLVPETARGYAGFARSWPGRSGTASLTWPP